MVSQPTESSVATIFLESVRARFASLKQQAEGAIEQVEDPDLYWSPDPELNSIAVLVQHLAGNMLSRWTDFLTSDGEKPWRDRDREFVSDATVSRPELMRRWAEGWECLSSALSRLTAEDLGKTVAIRGQRLPAADAILWQFSHYASHVGQIVFLAKHRRGAAWRTLSIPRGGSRAYPPQSKD